MIVSRSLLAAALCLVATPASAQLLIVPIPGAPLPICPAISPVQRQRAFADAKRHLPRFWQTYREAWVKPGRFMVLGSFLRRDGSYAYLWQEVTGISGTTFRGRLTSSDTRDPAFRKNDKTDGQLGSVIDWGVKSQLSGRWYGFFLRRASLPNCTPAQRTEVMNRFLTQDAVP